MTVTGRTPLVSVVVLSFNRFEYTDITLKALSALSSGTDYELIVVDNGSEAPIPEILSKWSQQGLIDKLILLPENLGTSGGFNAGFEASDPNSKFLTKLDNDIQILTDNWLAEILAIFDEVQDAGIVSTDIINHKGLKQLDRIKLPSGREVKDWAGWRAGGGGMTFRRESFKKFGGFSEDFPNDLKLMPDDYEYYFRLASHGLKGFYACASKSKMQTAFNDMYKDYKSASNRQYTLLRSRFFGVAKGKQNQFDPYIVNATNESVQVKPGTYVTIKLTINSSRDMESGIGMTLRNIENKNPLYDKKNDKIIKLHSGYCENVRQFYVPENISAGTYSITLSVCKGFPGRSASYDTYTLKNNLEISTSNLE